MNLYKFTFDLKGSSNLMQTVTIPTDSKYSVGIKICDGENEVVLDDATKITIQDDKYIYTPTEIFNNYAVFAGATGSDAGESKTYQVNFHKDESEPEVISQAEYVNTGSTTKLSYITIACNDFLAAIGDDDVEKWDLHNFKYYFDGMAVAKNGLRMSDDYQAAAGMVHAYSEKYGFIAGFNIASRPGQYILVPSKSGDKYGWRIYNATTEQQKYGQPIDEADIITTGKFSDYGVDLVGKMFIILQGIKSSIPANTTYHQKVEMGESIPAVNANFKGVNVKTNDSKISNWAVTDSQMKVVYADEWETMKDNADDRVIYFVVDRPTPPTPVPPKPTPSGDVKWGVGLEGAGELDSFDPTNIEDCLLKNPSQMVKYTRDGVDYYIMVGVSSSSSAEVIEEASKVDQLVVMIGDYPEDDVYLEAPTLYVKDGNLNYNGFKKRFNTDVEMYEYWDNYIFSRVGEDEDQPNTSNPLPADFDTWEINVEEGEGVPITNETDEYVYFEGMEDVMSPMKLFKNMDTFAQWTSVDPV